MTQFQQFDEAAALINNASRIIMMTHVQPDGDAIGSMMGLALTLTALGKTVFPAVDGGCPESLAFLPGSSEVLDDVTKIDADLWISLDVSDDRRSGIIGTQARAKGLKSINLDHHVTNTGFADANIMDPAYVSTTETVIRILDHMHLPISKEAAVCLLCGLVTDTMAFRISAVTAETFGFAQRLMAAGADLTMIMQNTLNRMPTAMLYLWAQVMPTVQIQDNVVWVHITIAAKNAANYHDTTDGGLVSILLQADDAYISCVFKEKDATHTEVHLRAIPGFNVAEVAFGLGGGGHTLASGATVEGTLAEVEARVIPILKEAVKKGTKLY